MKLFKIKNITTFVSLLLVFGGAIIFILFADTIFNAKAEELFMCIATSILGGILYFAIDKIPERVTFRNVLIYIFKPIGIALCILFAVLTFVFVSQQTIITAGSKANYNMGVFILYFAAIIEILGSIGLGAGLYLSFKLRNSEFNY